MFVARINPFVLGLLLLTYAGAAIAQEPSEFPGPEKEHAFLKKFVGQWVTTSECDGALGLPPMKCTGTINARMLGEFWVLNKTDATMGDTKVSGMQTIGYDSQKKKYVGTWVDSMMNYLWQYEGAVDGNTLTLEAEGPDFVDAGKLSKFRDSYEFKTADEVVIKSSMLTGDGQWVTFMTGTATRQRRTR